MKLCYTYAALEITCAQLAYMHVISNNKENTHSRLVNVNSCSDIISKILSKNRCMHVRRKMGYKHYE